MTLEIKRNNTDPSILLANPRLKIIGSTDGTFPARGHHQPGEMYGVWFHPYKLLDGFKMHVKEKGLESSNLQLLADGITVGISGNTYEYNQSVGHSHFDIKRNDYIPVHGTGFVSEYEFKNKDLQKTHTLFWQFTLNVNIRKVWDPDLENVFHNSNLQNTFDLERQKILVFDEKLHVGFALSLNQAVKNADFCQEKLPLTTRTKDQIKILGKLEVKAGETKKLRFNMLGFTDAWNEKIEENLTLLTNLSHTAISEQRKIWLNGWLDQSRWIDLNTKKENYKEKSGNLSYGIDTNNREKTLELTRELLPWLRFNTACLEQDTVKRRGLTAGQPEYPWWFTCDSYYACQGLLCAGQFELVRETIEIILHSCQENEPKYKVPHEITTAGKIVHPGNMQEQAQILSLIAYYFSWTNDRSWLLQNRDSILNIYQLMDEATQGGSTFVKGYGITEIAGLNLRLIDTAVYMIEAYEAMTILMRILKQDEVENTRIKAEKMKHHFLQAYWLEDEGLFADCLASYEELEDVIEIIIQDLNLSKEQTQSLYSSIEVAKKNAKELKPWLLNRNWVIWTPFETKLAMQRQAEMALPQVMTADYLGPWEFILTVSVKIT